MRIAPVVATFARVVFALAIAGTADARVVDLGASKVGGPPAGFEFARTGSGAPGNWVVLQDRTAPSGRVIAQTSGDATEDRYPLAIYAGTRARDLDVSVRFRSLEGRIDQAAGIALRVQSPGSYYVVRASAL